MDYILYLLAGALAGFLSGLFGLGGGVIIVPVLIFMFTASNLSVEIITHLAIGTSLATIVVTSISSALTHHQKALFLGPYSLDSSRHTVGSGTGRSFRGIPFRPNVAVTVWHTAICGRISVAAIATYRVVAAPGNFLLGSAGILAGAISSLFGIGGGTLSTPFLTSVGVSIRQAVGSAAACGLPIALAGPLTCLQGWTIKHCLRAVWVIFLYRP